MPSRIFLLVLTSFLFAGFSYCQKKPNTPENAGITKDKAYEVEKTESEWRALLSPEAFDVLRKKGTEYAFTGKYYDFKGKGIYSCAGCNNELFDSKTKYNSGSGWPSFYQPINEKAIDVEIDRSLGMVREEILCSKCGGHLGHVFNDGPQPTGLRYCINSVSLNFKKK